jgi:hypothetical protein
MMVKRLSEKSGYYQKDVRSLLQCMDEVVFDAFNEATLDDEIQVQMTTGIKLGCKIVGTRERVDPRTLTPIIVGETTKPFAKFSQDFRLRLQEAYDNRNDG